MDISKADAKVKIVSCVLVITLLLCIGFGRVSPMENFLGAADGNSVAESVATISYLPVGVEGVKGIVAFTNVPEKKPSDINTLKLSLTGGKVSELILFRAKTFPMKKVSEKSLLMNKTYSAKQAADMFLPAGTEISYADVKSTGERRMAFKMPSAGGAMAFEYYPTQHDLAGIKVTYLPGVDSLAAVEWTYEPAGMNESSVEWTYEPAGLDDTEVEWTYRPVGATAQEVEWTYSPVGIDSGEIEWTYRPAGTATTEVEWTYTPTISGGSLAKIDSEPILKPGFTGSSLAKIDSEPILKPGFTGTSLAKIDSEPILKPGFTGNSLAKIDSEPILRPGFTAIAPKPLLEVSERIHFKYSTQKPEVVGVKFDI